MSITAGLAVAAPIIGGMMGNAAAAKDRKQAKAMFDKAFYELQKVGLPPDLSKAIIYREFEKVGELTPEMEEDIEVASSQVAEIEEDSSLRDSQMDALRLIQDRAKVGLSAEDRMNLNKIRNEVQRDAESKRQQIIQNFAARGQGGSGAELVSQLQAGQAGANLQSAEADRVAAMAQQNALRALGQQGEMAGSIRGQDFDVARTKGQAADELERFRVENSRGMQQRNIDRANRAQADNLKLQQDISTANTQLYNQELSRQQEEKGRFFDRKLDKAKAVSGAASDRGSQYNQSGQDTASQHASIGAGIGSGLGALSKYMSDKEKDEQ